MLTTTVRRSPCSTSGCARPAATVPYWDATAVVCTDCAVAAARRFDVEGWPAEPPSPEAWDRHFAAVGHVARTRRATP